MGRRSGGKATPSVFYKKSAPAKAGALKVVMGESHRPGFYTAPDERLRICT
jgi:hypothetical protein